MAFVGQTVDPWDVPVKQAVQVMQKIWDATNDSEYEITASSAVFQKVYDGLVFGIILIFMFQTIQRLADSWRNSVGSTGISTSQAICDSEETLQDSDLARQEFASYYLKDLRFLYKDCSRDDKTARKPGYYPICI